MATINNLFIDQGTTFSIIVQIFSDTNVPLDITNYTANSQIRKSYYSSNPTATFDASIADGPNGKIALNLTSSETANIKSGRYVYDVEIKNGVEVYRAAEGIVTVYPQVTR